MPKTSNSKDREAKLSQFLKDHWHWEAGSGSYIFKKGHDIKQLKALLALQQAHTASCIKRIRERVVSLMAPTNYPQKPEYNTQRYENRLFNAALEKVLRILDKETE